MAGLSPAAQDRLLLLGLGITAGAVIGLMRQMLVYYRDAAALPPQENKSQYITQDVEDSLKLTTLNKLLDSPNYSIQETASTIVCERALHDESTIDVLLWCITRKDYATRERGVRALNLMLSIAPSATLKEIYKPETYNALVKCLEYCLADYKHAEFDPQWDNWSFRDVIERQCLLILATLSDRHGVDGLIRVRFVFRWLAKEPWGKDDRQRQMNFLEFLNVPSRMRDLVLPLTTKADGRRQLCRAKLLPKDFEWEVPGPRDVRMINGEGTAGEDFDGMFVEGRRRRDQSSEEEHIRRRHREAMVFNDGTRPLARDDIIQRER